MELKIQSGEMEKEALLRIAAACPKVVIDFPQSISGGESNTETVIALGSAAATWTMHDSDRDNGVFSPFGLFCSNLKGVTVRAFSETAFGRLFTLPKNKLRHVFVMFLGVSEISSVLNVLTEKVNSSESFFCAGVSMSVELLRGFVLSQKELKIVCFYGNDWCSCQSYRYPGIIVGEHKKTWDCSGRRLCLLASKIAVWRKLVASPVMNLTARQSMSTPSLQPVGGMYPSASVAEKCSDEVCIASSWRTLIFMRRRFLWPNYYTRS